MDNPVVWATILSLVLVDTTALVPAVSENLHSPQCPDACQCGHPSSHTTAAALICNIMQEEQWAYFCHEITDYSKAKPDLSLRLVVSEPNETGLRLQSLECLPSLELLDLSGLGEKVFDVELIKGIDAKHINLSHNGLVAFPEKLFSGNPTLEGLDLSHNCLKELTGDVFQSLQSLRTLDLSFNQIHNVPIVTFQDLASLTSLNLEHNSVDGLTLDHFPNSGALTLLNLRNNSLSTFIIGVNTTVNETFQNLQSLDISQNPIECSCVLGDVFSSMPSIKNIFVNAKETVCSSPDELRGRLLANVPQKELQCSIPKNVVTYPASRQSMAIYHDITLECDSDAYPSPSNLWITPWGDKLYSGSSVSLLSQMHNQTFDIDNLASSRSYYDPHVFLHSKIELTDDQNLKISNFRGSFSGKYVCVSLNVVGNKNQSVKLEAYSRIKSAYLDSIFIGGYCATGFLIFGLIVGAIRNCVIRLQHHFHFRVPIFSKSPSIHKPEESADGASVEENNSCSGGGEDRPGSDDEGAAGISDALHVQTSEEDAPRSPDKVDSGSPKGWRTPAFFESLEEARGRFRYGVGRKMDHLRKNVQSIRDSGQVYVHTIKESSTSAANKVKASMVYGVETVKSQVQSFKELCGTGNMGGQTISMMSVETDVDTNEQKDIIRQVTFV